MNLYNGYCYATINEVAEAISSEPFKTGANEFLWVTPSSSTGNTVNLQLYKKTDVAGLSNSLGTFSRIIPTCNEVGPYPPVGFMSGLTLADSVELSWLVIGVWVVAFAFRSMRRPIR